MLVLCPKITSPYVDLTRTFWIPKSSPSVSTTISYSRNYSQSLQRNKQQSSLQMLASTVTDLLCRSTLKRLTKNWAHQRSDLPQLTTPRQRTTPWSCKDCRSGLARSPISQMYASIHLGKYWAFNQEEKSWREDPAVEEWDCEIDATTKQGRVVLEEIFKWKGQRQWSLSVTHQEI